MSEKPIQVSASQEDGFAQMGLRPALLSSREAGWNGINVELQRQPAGETPEIQPLQHSISVETGQPYTFEWKENGRFKSVTEVYGNVALNPAYQDFQGRWNAEMEIVLILLEPTLIAQIAEETFGFDGIEFVSRKAVRDPLIQGMGLTLKQKLESRDWSDRLYVESAANFLAIHLIQHYSSRQAVLPERQNRLSKHQLQQAIAYIQAHLNDVSLSAIANELDLSQYYFCRQFKQAMGVSPHQYVLQQRVERAKYLLKTTRLSVTSIAHQVGFADQSQLAVQFRKFIGTTPKAYRDSL